MNTKVLANPSWSTAAFDDPADTLPMELSALGAHLDTCCGGRGRLFALRCAAEAVNRFIVARLVTSLTVVVIVLAVFASLAL